MEMQRIYRASLMDNVGASHCQLQSKYQTHCNDRLKRYSFTKTSNKKKYFCVVAYLYKKYLYLKKIRMKKYVKKPVVIEAIQYLTDNHEEVCAFIGDFPHKHIQQDETIIISTLEGEHITRHGDYVIKGIAGEFYPCKPDIFKDSYEEI